MTEGRVRAASEEAQATLSLETLLERMWLDYVRLNPLAWRVYGLLRARGEEVANDHIALRTFDLPRVDLGVLARPFLERGYVERGAYEFPEKQLVARHFEGPAGRPKVFISQLRVEALPHKAAELIGDLVDAVPEDLAERPDFCLTGRVWPLSFAQYRDLLAVSDYAAWVAAFGFRPNHFTVDVNALRTFDSLAALDAFLKQSGIVLNTSGGEIKGSPEELLEQSSTLANLVEVEFADGVHAIPACYYEFARRYRGRDGRLYQGFIAASADKIFESTAQGQAL